MPSPRLASALLATALAGCSPGTPASPSAPVGRSAAPGAGAPAPAPPAADGAHREAASTLIERSNKALEAGDLDAAAKRLEQALAAEPTNRDALGMLAQITQRQASNLPRPLSSPLFLRSAELVRKLRAAYPDLKAGEKRFLAIAFYNEACTLAIQGETTRAVKALAESVADGFEALEQIEQDTELDTLRKLPEFEALTRGLERRLIGSLMATSKPFDFDFRLHDLDNKPVALADFKGKVTVVDLWGTWCAPCRKQVPHLATLYQRDHDKGLEVVGLNYENEEGDAARKVVREFVKDHGIPYPCLIGNEATRNQFPTFEGYPTVLFLDRQGKVRLKLVGYQPLSALETAAETLLDEGKPQTAKP